MSNCLQRLSADDKSRHWQAKLTLLLCLLCKLLISGLLIFFKINFFNKFFKKYHDSVKQLGSRSGLFFVEPDLGPNCLQRLSVDSRGELCLLGKLFICCLLIFFKINFLEKFCQKYHDSVKQFGSRSGTTFCRPDLGPNGLQRLSVDGKSHHC